MKDYSKDLTMMRCPGCNVGSSDGVFFNNCAGCGGKRYIKKPGYDSDETLVFKKSWLFRQVDIYTLKIAFLGFLLGFCIATLIWI